MSLKKYFILVLCGVALGSMVAFAYTWKSKTALADITATRIIASEKLNKNYRSHSGKVAAPIYVQIQMHPDSQPEKGYYKLRGHIVFNQPIGNFRFQWALPEGAQVISGDFENELSLTAGEDEWDTEIEVALGHLDSNQQLMFDVSYDRGGVPMGASDTLVYRPLGLERSLDFGL